MVEAICSELNIRKSYLNNERINTIYFGGGTPSVLNLDDLTKIVSQINKEFNVADDIEFTFECNPDDLSEQKLLELKAIGVNRLSIGIQSFENDQLEFMNRAHNANEAETCLKLAKKIGFDNITIDLIYGLPNTEESYWKSQIEKALSFNVPHISAYCLTIEKNTTFGHLYDKGKLNPLSDELSLNQFKLLQSELLAAGYEHYEISNFAKPKGVSKHNSAYWLGEKYLGVGPSAHSYNGKTRRWNLAHNINYIKAVNENKQFFEIETLSAKDEFNEFLLTRLRTKWGVDLDDLFSIYSNPKIETLNRIKTFEDSKDVEVRDNVLYLTNQGKFIADFITAELFV